ncbi:MAG: S8 family serine peptidase [Desulfobacterales bacterium]|nr:S8 family serine peptidase [Desulfobacterales bacterium]
MYKTSSTILVILLLACPIPVFSQETKGLEYVPGELLVRFRSGVTRHVAQATHRFLGSRAIKRFKRINVDHIKIPEAWSVEEAISVYGLDPDVKYVEPNYIRRAFLTPNDPDFDRLWGLHNAGQTGGTEDADIDAPEAWDTQTGSSSVVIAVIDTGVDLDHEDLKENIWMNTGEDWVDGIPGNNGLDDDGNGKTDDYYGWDFVNGDNDPDDDNHNDEYYHGTHVSGIIAAKGNNMVGITGVCWSASIMPLKVLDYGVNGSVAHGIEAISYAINKGAKIINMSLGGHGYSHSEYDAIKSARDNGLLFVAAAGNDGTDNDESPVYPASYDLDNIITVAASDENDNLASWSNYGSLSVDVAAPGVDIYSTKPGDSYEYLSGTSMAVPHVSGLAALIWSEDDRLTYRQVKDRTLNGVDVIPTMIRKVLMSGRINANNSIDTSPHEPAMPSHLAAGALSTDQIDLSWTDNSFDESGFKIERKTGPEGTYSHIVTIGANGESSSDTDLREATTYYYRVSAFNSAGNSTYSNEANATTYPAAPSNLSATAVSAIQINLSWTDNSSGESGFKIERKTGSGGTYSLITAISTNITSYSDTELRGSTTYYYRVRAYNSSGSSTYSNEASDTTFSSSCFIATAVYGSPMEAHVKVLRQFRDCFLHTTSVGGAFIDFYYTYSPPVAGFIARHDRVRLAVRWSLLPLVGFSYVAIHLSPAAALGLVVLLSCLVGASTTIALCRVRLRRQS